MPLCEGALLRIERHCTPLQELKAGNTDCLTDAGVHELVTVSCGQLVASASAATCPQLTVLPLSYCEGITNAGLKLIVTRLHCW